MKQFFLIIGLFIFQNNIQAQATFNKETFKVQLFTFLDTVNKVGVEKMANPKSGLNKFFINNTDYFGIDRPSEDTLRLQMKFKNTEHDKEIMKILEPILDEYANKQGLKKTVLDVNHKKQWGRFKTIDYKDSNGKIVFGFWSWGKLEDPELVIMTKFNLDKGLVATNDSNRKQNTNGNGNTTSSNGISIATAKLERRDYRKGIIILYYGENRIISDCYLYAVKLDKDENEESIANSLKAKIAGYAPYMYYEFKEGYDCISAEGYLLKKGVNKTSIICR